jgi:hypothetical protein
MQAGSSAKQLKTHVIEADGVALFLSRWTLGAKDGIVAHLRCWAREATCMPHRMCVAIPPDDNSSVNTTGAKKPMPRRGARVISSNRQCVRKAATTSNQQRSAILPRPVRTHDQC